MTKIVITIQNLKDYMAAKQKIGSSRGNQYKENRKRINDFKDAVIKYFGYDLARKRG